MGWVGMGQDEWMELAVVREDIDSRQTQHSSTAARQSYLVYPTLSLTTNPPLLPSTPAIPVAEVADSTPKMQEDLPLTSLVCDWWLWCGRWVGRRR